MKLLHRLRLINWHYFTDVVVDVGGSLLLTGDNGSGKSTILDAIQYVLVADLRKVRFNISAHEETRRDLLGYVRCKTGEEREGGQPYLRPGDVTAYVVLEFKDTRTGSYFLLGAVIDAYGEGSWESKFFKLENCRLDDALFLEGRRPKNIREFKAGLKGLQGEVYPSVERYQADLLLKLGSLSERFFSTFVKAFSFKAITDIRRFVYDYILDERPIKVDVMRENLRHYRQYGELVLLTKEKIAALESIEALFASLAQERARALLQDYLILRGQQEKTAGELAETRRREEGLLAAIAAAEETRAMLARQVEQLEQEYLAYRDTLATNSLFQLQERLQRECAGLEEELRRLREEHRRLERLAAETAEALGALLVAAELAERPERAALESARQLMLDLRAGTLPAEPPAVDPLKEALASLGQYTSRELFRWQQEAQELQAEEKSLAQSIASLEKGRFTYDPKVTELRQVIAEHVRDDRGRPLMAYVLCELLQIPDEKWQNAVEGYLNTQRFDLLVEPSAFDAALAVYERFKRARQIHGVGLVNTRRVVEFAGRAEPNSLAREVETGNRYARGYVDMLLGRVIKCESEQELKQFSRAITPTCMVYQNHTARQISFHVYETWYIGERALARQLERQRQRREEVIRLLAEAHGKEQRWEELRRLAARNEGLIAAPGGYETLRREAAVREELAAKRQELAALDLSQIQELRDRVEEKKRQLAEARRRKEELAGELGSLRTSLERVRADQAELQAQEETAARELAHFTAREPEVARRGEERYQRERRRLTPAELVANFSGSRKGLETIIQKREQDVWEALSAYNSRYHFGAPVDTMDIRPYVEERRRLVESELPQYEEKIFLAQQAAEQEFKEHFIYKMKENIENARGEFNFLNEALKEVRFGGDRYQFVVSPAPALRPIYDMIMDTDLLAGGASIFEGSFMERHREALDALFEHLLGEESEYLEESISQHTDYRTYLDYDIKILSDSGETTWFSKVCREKSGGETQTPYYVSLVASFVQLYRARTNQDSARLVVFDEAFNRMDSERIENSLRFINDLGLQVIVAAPTDKCEYIAPLVSTTLLVMRSGHQVWLEDYRQLRLEPWTTAL